MRLLLDTHTLIWIQEDPVKLSVPATTAVEDPANTLLLSTATIWELAIKVATGKLILSFPYRIWIDCAFADLNLIELLISVDHAERLTRLPFHHRDPFDRMLASQALVENIAIVSNDAIFDAYGVRRIW